MTSVSQHPVTLTGADLREAFMKSFDISRTNDCIMNFAENFFGPQPGENGYEKWQELIATGYNPNHVKSTLQQKLAKFQTSLFDKLADVERQETVEFIKDLTDDEILDWKKCMEEPARDGVASTATATAVAVAVNGTSNESS